MSSPKQLESTINQYQAEFNELAADLSTAFDTISRLSVQLEGKLNDFNAFIDREISSNIAPNKFAEYVAANPRWLSLRQSVFEDEVKLLTKIRSILALSSNEPVDNEANQSGDNSDIFNDPNCTQL